MKLFFYITFSLLILMSNLTNAENNENTKDFFTISVNGLVCDFCARSIEKLFMKRESVLDIDVNLEKMLITVRLKKNKNLDNQTIKQIINDSGYDIVEINRE